MLQYYFCVPEHASKIIQQAYKYDNEFEASVFENYVVIDFILPNLPLSKDVPFYIIESNVGDDIDISLMEGKLYSRITGRFYANNLEKVCSGLGFSEKYCRNIETLKNSSCAISVIKTSKMSNMSEEIISYNEKAGVEW